MEFIRSDININFIGNRKYGFVFSSILILISVMTLIYHNGPHYGVDFAGGTVIQVKFSASTDTALVKKGMESIADGKASVQRFGEKDDNEYLIRMDISGSSAEDITQHIENALKTSTGNPPEIRRIEMVGPQVGEDLREKALFAIFFALLFITIYISGRFELQWLKSGLIAAILIGSVILISRLKVSIPMLILTALIVAMILFWKFGLRYAMGAIVALVHDVFITVGVFSLLGKEFSLPIVAALLTIIGYSLNDTIIVFDRIRENLGKYTKYPLDYTINRSINETLSRTILTSGTTLIVVTALFVLGGGIIHDFAFALIIGIAVGTYSSIYVASPILLAWEGYKKR
jgi:preprotein translocase subunit SecF